MKVKDNIAAGRTRRKNIKPVLIIGAGHAGLTMACELKAAGRLTSIGTLRNTVAQSLRNIVAHAMLGLKSVKHAVADTMTEVTIG